MLCKPFSFGMIESNLEISRHYEISSKDKNSPIMKNKFSHHYFYLLFCCLFTISQVTTAQPSNQAQKPILTLNQKQELKAKEAKLKSLLSQNPRVPELHLNLGNNYWEQGRDGKPIRHYLAAIKLNPNYAEAYYNLANIYFEQGEHESAIQNYEKAIQVKPSLLQAWNGLANALIDEKKYSEAIEKYQKVISMDSSNKDAVYNLCSVYIYSALYNKAISACKNATEIVRDARSFNNLGNSYFRTNQFDLALENYKKALTIDSELPEAHFNIAAISLVHNKNKTEALSRQKILEAIDPQKSHKLLALIKASGI